MEKKEKKIQNQKDYPGASVDNYNDSVKEAVCQSNLNPRSEAIKD